jgi:hypothetical protein
VDGQQVDVDQRTEPEEGRPERDDYEGSQEQIADPVERTGWPKPVTEGDQC